MVLDAVANFVRGNADGAVGGSDTTIDVISADIFPDPSSEGNYNVVVWDADNFPRPTQDTDVEIVRVTGRDTANDTLTVTRGEEGTVGVSHPDNSALHLSPTAKMFSDIESTFGDFWDAGDQELTADVNNQSVNTGDADVTGVTYIEASRSSQITGISADSWRNIVDREDTDNKDEFSAGQQFSPDSTGRYEVEAQARINPSSDGDRAKIRIRDKTNGNTILERRHNTGGQNHDVIDLNTTKKFDSANNYEIQASNQDSTWDLKATDTDLVIKKSVVHP